METLWSMSTTIREAERIVGFLKTAVELDGEVWNFDSQIKFQTLLIKNRQYLNNPDNTQSFQKLSPEQAELLKDKSIVMTYEHAKGIFDAKQYKDPDMRGRQSMSPLVKLGLVYITDREKKVAITDIGWKLAKDEIDFNDFMREALLKIQYPNPYDEGFQTWNTKPFINTLRLIKRVNEKCHESGQKEKGISTLEFGIFALSLKSYELIDRTAEEILSFRNRYESFKEEKARDSFVSDYIGNYLADFKNPEKNVREYTDNMVRYLRLTKYIYIRGKYAHTYIDLEPRRMTEINAILEADSGQAGSFTKEEWRDYMGVYGTYELPFETVEKLTKIASDIGQEIRELETALSMEETESVIPATKEALKAVIEERRSYRTRLQNLKIKADYHRDTQKIDDAIGALRDIRTHNKANLAKKYSIELEKWSNVALNIINDCKEIKPNAPVGDDNEPIYTAPSGVADIECRYENFGAICEVTMLTNRDQWHNEGQPVMRHLRDFENANTGQPNYCLFVAPSIHTDTVNTFYMSVKYEYEGRPQKIIPVTIVQLEDLLKTVKTVKEQGRTFRHTELMRLYDRCCEVAAVANSTCWLEHIANTLNDWRAELAAL